MPLLVRRLPYDHSPDVIGAAALATPMPDEVHRQGVEEALIHLVREGAPEWPLAASLAAAWLDLRGAADAVTRHLCGRAEVPKGAPDRLLALAPAVLAAPESDPRVPLAWLLGLGSDAATLEPLLGLTRDPDSLVRRQALRSLDRRDPDLAGGAAVQGLKDGDDEV